MSKVTFYLGKRSEYNANEYEDGLYFATDTQELLLNDLVYGAGAVTGMTFSADGSAGTLTLTSNDGISVTVEITGATISLAGLMTASDKNELNTATTNIYSLLSSISNIESNYAKKDEIPTKTSELENDSGYITENDVGENIYIYNLHTFYQGMELLQLLDSFGVYEDYELVELLNKIATNSSTIALFNIDGGTWNPTDGYGSMGNTTAAYFGGTIEIASEERRGFVTDKIIYFIASDFESIPNFYKIGIEIKTDYDSETETYTFTITNEQISAQVGITTIISSGSGELSLKSSVSGMTATITGSVDLSDYAKTSDLDDYAKISDLTNYVTSDSLNNTLGDYVTNNSLSTTLGDYVSNSELTTTLGDYAKTSDLSDYATKDDLDSKQDALTAGTGIDISDNVISAKDAILDALREKYYADPSLLNKLCFDTETWQVYCWPYLNTIRDYAQMNGSNIGTVTVDFGVRVSALDDANCCLGLKGIPLVIESDDEGIGHLTLSLSVFGSLSSQLEIAPYKDNLITVMDIPPTAKELSDKIEGKQDELQYYTEYESLNRGVEIRVADDERNGSYITITKSDINLNPSARAYYNSKEIATVEDLDTKQDVLTAGTNVAITSDNVISVNLNGYATKAQLSAVVEDIDDIITLNGLREKFPSATLINMLSRWFSDSYSYIHFAQIMDYYECGEFSSCRVRFVLSTTGTGKNFYVMDPLTRTYVTMGQVSTSDTTGYSNTFFDLILQYDKDNDTFYELTNKYSVAM